MSGKKEWRDIGLVKGIVNLLKKEKMKNKSST
jgi:hypothetical protein